MTNIADLARHWTRQTEKGKGIRIEASALDVLNAIGVGELILSKAAEAQRNACHQRIKGSTPAANTASPTIDEETERSAARTSRSFGMTGTQDATAAAARAQRTSNRRKRTRRPQPQERARAGRLLRLWSGAALGCPAPADERDRGLPGRARRPLEHRIDSAPPRARHGIPAGDVAGRDRVRGR